MLAERRHVEERDLQADASLVSALAALPIYEVHGGDVLEADGVAASGAGDDGAACVSLRVEEHRLAPSGGHDAARQRRRRRAHDRKFYSSSSLFFFF